jgi:DNA-binding Lrp family transcriptional regulator
MNTPIDSPVVQHREPDELDQRLLNELQSGFPLVTEPFAALGQRLDLDGAAVLARIEALKAASIIRQISAIFDSRRLGYQSSLVAMKFAPEDVDAGAAVINAHPGVSHNYKRNHDYNLWFTIAVPPGKELPAEVDKVAAKARPIQTWLLPTLKLFKIGVNLDMTGEQPVTALENEATNIGLRSAKAWQRDPDVPELSADERAAVAVLQLDVPLVDRPFADLAARRGLSEARLLALANAMLESALMRRFAAVLHHRKAGFRANAMGVWIVEPDRIDAVGAQMAEYKAVSHCYERPVYPDWPYSVFTMIHGHHSRDCEAVVEAIAAATGVSGHALLYSTKEYKKTRVRYFMDDDAFDADTMPERG